MKGGRRNPDDYAALPCMLFRGTKAEAETNRHIVRHPSSLFLIENRPTLSHLGIQLDDIETIIHEACANHKLETAARETRGEVVQHDLYPLLAVASGPGGATGVIDEVGSRAQHGAGPGAGTVQQQ